MIQIMYLTASYFSGYCSEGADRDRSMSGDSGGLRFRPTRRVYTQQSTTDQEPVGLSWIPETTTVEMSPPTIIHGSDGDDTIEEVSNVKQEEGYLGVPTKTPFTTSGSADTLVPTPSSPSNLSAVTLVGSTGSCDKGDETPLEAAASFQYGKAPTSPLPERVVPKRPPRSFEMQAATVTNTPTVTKIQLPQPVEVKPPTSIMKSPPTTNIGSTTTVNTSTTPVMTTQKATISPPSIGVTFDRFV
jgi:hypothetical protein